MFAVSSYKVITIGIWSNNDLKLHFAILKAFIVFGNIPIQRVVGSYHVTRRRTQAVVFIIRASDARESCAVVRPPAPTHYCANTTSLTTTGITGPWPSRAN